jgi:subtilisin family serine protease
MRSNDPANTSNSNSSTPNSKSDSESRCEARPSRQRTRSRARVPLALTAMIAVLSLGALSLGTSADAAWFGARGFGGRGPTGFTGNRVPGHSIRIDNPGGRIRTGGGHAPDGCHHIAGGDNRPHRPRLPRIPIIVAVPPAVTPATQGAVSSRLSYPGGGSSSTGQQARRVGNGVPPADERRYVPDEVLIQLESSVPTRTVDALARRLQLDRVESFDSNGITMFRWRIPDRRPVPAVVRLLQVERIVLAAQPNYLYRLQDEAAARDQPSAPVAEGDPGQYAVAKLHLPQAHVLAKGEKVLVAVIDSGVDATHPELAGMIEASFDALGSGEKAHAHGTGVAGAIVAHARLLGVAPQARILAVQAFSAKAPFGATDKTAEATTYSINKGIDWAMSRGARVINMSFAGPRDPSVEQRMAQARRQGLVLVAAAGNAGPKSPPLFPAAYPNVIAVTATDADDKLFAGANQGRHIAVAAPGVDILLPASDTGYQVTTGTSFAAAEVSGIVALMLERRPDLGHDGVRKALSATARDLGPKGFDPQFGAGLVDAYAAIRSLEGAPATTAASTTPVTTGANVVPASSRQ